MNTPAAAGAAPDEIAPEDEIDPIRGTTAAEEAAADRAIEAARAKNPDLYMEKVRTPIPKVEGGDVDQAGGFRCLLGVLKVVEPAAWQMILEKAQHQDAAQRASVDRLMFNACVVYPVGPELLKLIKRYPAMVKIWSAEATEMSGNFKGSVREKV